MASHFNRNAITSLSKRENIIALWSSGFNQKNISQMLNISKQTVSNIINRLVSQGTMLPGKPGGKERTISTPPVVEFVEYCKLLKPSSLTSEIQQGLIDNGICTAANLPARSTVGDILKKDLNFTWKKLSIRPEESLTHERLLQTLNYIMYISGVDPSTIHFFDESSVVKTTPNRIYGHSEKGCPAIEVKRYTSNCSYTVNLLHSRFGVDYFNILEGPSNGFEMLDFFEDSLQVLDPIGNRVLANGDTVDFT
jgi:transposase